MKIRNSLFAVSSIALAGLLTGCGPDVVKPIALDCGFPDDPTVPAPGWVCDQPVEGIEVSAVGIAEKSGVGIGFDKNMADTDARVQMAQALKVHVQNLVKQFAEKTGVGKGTIDKVNSSVTNQVTDQTLKGTKRQRSIVSPGGVIYVLIGMNEALAAKATEEIVRSSMNNDEALWQQFKAQKGQDELAAAIAAGRQ